MAVVLLVLLVGDACTSTETVSQTSHLDRPVDIAFGCMMISDAGNSGPLPLSACGPAPDARIQDAGIVDAGFVDGSTSGGSDGGGYDAGAAVDSGTTVDAVVDGSVLGDGGVLGDTAMVIDAIDAAGTVDAPGISSSTVVARSDPASSSTVVQRGSLKQFGFIVEGSRGQVLVADLGAQQISDSDPFTPENDGLPVGTLPVELATTSDGCDVVVANYGSCDLAVIDVERAIHKRAGAVTRHHVTVEGGIVAARPLAIAAPISDREPADCTASTPRVVYVAFPGCHLVAAVDATSGQLVAGVRFTADGSAEISGSDVACPVECGELAKQASRAAEDGRVPDSPEPASLAIEPEGRRLYVGFVRSSNLGVVDLDAGGLPSSVVVMPLEGEAIGLQRLATSGDVRMVETGGAGSVFRFVYGIASDGSIRVADVTPGRAPRECDAQVDPRFLHEVRNVSELACLATGAGYPRRAGAEGPGIRLPSGAPPLDVAFIRRNDSTAPGPTILRGVFAIVTADDQYGVDLYEKWMSGTLPAGGDGVVFYVNVNDLNYGDFEVVDDPASVDLVLALPHTIRDAVNGRQPEAEGTASCTSVYSESINTGPVRLVGEVGRTGKLIGMIAESGKEICDWEPGGEPGEAKVEGVEEEEVEIDKRLRFVPDLHWEYCTTTGENPTKVPVPALSLEAPAESRDRSFADLWRIRSAETWTVTWEGTLPSVAETPSGRVAVESGSVFLRDWQDPFCAMGVEQFDLVQLIGCKTDSDCGIGEVCFVHPMTPSDTGLTSFHNPGGWCIAAGTEDAIASACAELLTSVRVYSAVQVSQDRLLLATQPVVMDWTPVDGCSGDEQCAAIERVKEVLGEESRRWVCAPAHAGAERKSCLMACGVDEPCANGALCDDGVCVLGPLPGKSCVASVQRYEIAAAAAFVVAGGQTGYLHRRIVDPASGQCIDDSAQSSLMVGRFQRIEEPCADSGLASLSPNPCSVVLEEPLVCSDSGKERLETRPSEAIRLRSVGMTFEIADVTVPLEEVPGVRYSPIPSGYELSFTIVGGHVPSVMMLGAALPERVRIGPDGKLWIVDSGDDYSSARRGQVLLLEKHPSSNFDDSVSRLK
ncbi:MAG: hypothetical protein V2A73_12835 [Pseudomonadota bacterium]